MEFEDLMAEGEKVSIVEIGLLLSVMYCGRVHVREWLSTCRITQWI